MEAPTRLRLIRKAKGLTQTKLAEMAGVMPPVVCGAENGHYVSPASLAKIAAVLGETEPARLLERAVVAAPEAAPLVEAAPVLAVPQAPAQPEERRVLDRLRTVRASLSS